MKRLLIASVALAVLVPGGAAVAQSPGPLVSEPICVEVHVAPNAGPQGDPSRYPDALTWLGLAIPANALATATVVACPGASPDASGAPPTPASAESCAIRNQGHDATVTFMGPGSKAMCAAYQRANGDWEDFTDVVPGSVVCRGDYLGLFWFVTDSGRQNIGKDSCAGLNQYANGGTLTIP